jgi:hypothetical protein
MDALAPLFLIVFDLIQVNRLCRHHRYAGEALLPCIWKLV